MRVTVNDQEKQLVENARALANLQAKRRGIVAELEACDVEIAAATKALRDVTPETPAEK